MAAPAGIFLLGDGDITNEAGAVVQGTAGGLNIVGDATITNLGTIGGLPSYNGIAIVFAGGYVTNQALITGYGGIVAIRDVATITNSGTITATGTGSYTGRRRSDIRGQDHQPRPRGRSPAAAESTSRTIPEPSSIQG